jgi:hypothetical protein
MGAFMELNRDSIISVSRAVRAMHGRDTKCREQLRRWGVVRNMDGTRVVIWGDVLDSLRSQCTPAGAVVVTPTRRRRPRRKTT